MAYSIETKLLEFSHDLSWGPVPKVTQEILCLSLLDWAAVGLAGAHEPVSIALRGVERLDSGQGTANIFGAKHRLSIRAAALINGATSHALDYDDTHFLHIGHPAVVVFSASLAVAQQMGATGREFLEAALVGYETSCRIGHWLGRAHYEAGFHMTATAGTFGATLAAARLMGANTVQMRAALGLAATRASGLKAQFGSMGKPYNAGMAAANGVEMALLAMAGLTSDSHGLHSFAASHAGQMHDGALEGLGREFISHDVSHKFHACCHGTHAMLEALGKLDVQAGEVKSVQITVHPRWLKVCNQPAPQTGLQAKFSYRMCAAFALAGLDTGAFETFRDANCADQGLCDLRDLVVVQGDENLPDTAAAVLIECHGGMARQASYDLARPLELSVRKDRMSGKLRGLIGAQKAARLTGAVAGLDQADNLELLVAEIF